MALLTAAGSFALNTGTGNQSVTGLDFPDGSAPKIIWLFCGSATATDTFTADWDLSYGVGVSSSKRYCFTMRADDNVPTSDTAQGVSSTKIVRLFSDGTGAPIDCEADLVSLDAAAGGNGGGFTINVTDAPAAAYLCGYIALGGDDIEQVDIQEFTVTNTATQDVTSFAFTPDFLMLLSNRQAAVGDTTGASIRIGMASSPTDAGCTWAQSDDNAGSEIFKVTELTGQIMAGGFVGTSTSFAVKAALSAWLSNGFTLSYGTQSTDGELVVAVAIKGGRHKVTSLTAPAATGVQTYSGLGIGTPQLVHFASVMNTASAAIVRADRGLMVGAASSSDGTEEASLMNTADDANTVMNVNNRFSNTKAVQMATIVTLQQDADLNAFAFNEFSLDWTTNADGIAREAIVWAVGPSRSRTPDSDRRTPRRRMMQRI